MNSSDPTGMYTAGGMLPNPAMYELYGPEGANELVQEINSSQTIGGLIGTAVVVSTAVGGPLIASGLEAPASVAAGELGVSAAAGSATTARVATTAAESVSSAASRLMQRKVLEAVMELGADQNGARAAAQGVANAERAVEMSKAGAIQQEIRAAVSAAKESVEKASQTLDKLPQ